MSQRYPLLPVLRWRLWPSQPEPSTMELQFSVCLWYLEASLWRVTTPHWPFKVLVHYLQLTHSLFTLFVWKFLWWSKSCHDVCRVSVIFNPRRACTARVTVLNICLPVCLSVTTFSVTTRNKPAKKWHQRVQRYTGYVAIFVKVLRSKVMAWKPSQQANVLISTGFPRPTARSMYFDSIRSHNEGRVSIPACYLIL